MPPLGYFGAENRVSRDPETQLQLQNLSANLRYLCDQRSSVSEVCKRINVNRQQFNKYLAGVHLPSKKNLRLISDFFQLSPDIFFWDNAEFRMLLDSNYFQAMETLRSSARVSQFLDTVMVESEREGAKLLGVYDRYQPSSIYRSKVIRSVHCVYRNDTFLQHYYIERFPDLDHQDRTAYVFKYHGFTIPLSGRIFTVDFEVAQRNEMTLGILVPEQRSSNRFLFGISNGIAANILRQPYSSRVALHYRGHGLLKREQIKRATVLDRKDPSLPSEVLQYFESVGFVIET